MGHTFRADGVAGMAIIYDNTLDDLPPTNPFAYRSRVLFWSGFRYPARIATLTGSVTFSTVPSNAMPPVTVVERKTLASHGRSGIPLVEGRWIGIGTSGADVPMVGSVPIQQDTSDPNRKALVRWGSLGADASNIYLYSLSYNVTGGGLAGITLSYEIHVLDWLLA